jgi:hypothetical protein
MYRACSTHGKESDCTQGFCTKIKGKRQLERNIHKCDDIIKMDLRGIRWSMDWTYLARDIDQWRALVGKVMNLPVA